MRKLFLLIPALILSMMMNAEVKTIGPDDPTETVSNKLIAALEDANDGDVIILKDGIYNEASGYVVFNKNVEVKAAEGANPIVQVVSYLKVDGGKHAIIDGLTFEGSAQGSRDQYFRFYAGDNILEVKNCTFNDVKKNIFRCESGNKFSLLDVKNCTFAGSLSNVMKLESNLCGAAHFDGCEFSNTAEIVIYGLSSSHLDECVINDCYFHDNAKQLIYFEASGTEGTETCDELTITNSTFANTTTLTNWISVIDIRPNSTTNTVKVTVDHCTFYNNPCVDSSHANIRTKDISDVTISNSIFMHPTELAQRATYCTGGGNINNCLTYNYTAEGTKGHAYGCTVNAASAVADPLFNDLANNKYTYSGDWTTMELSPARGAATDGSDLGDPRWYSAEVLTEVDFSSPYQLVGAKAQITGNLWYNSDDAYLYFNNKSQNGTAKWKIHAERACVVGVELNMHEGSPTVHKIRIEVLDAEGNSVGEFAEQASTLPGTLIIPAEGDYTIILNDDQAWTSAQIDNITLSYIGGAVQAMPGMTNIDDAWFSSNGTRTAGEYIAIPAGHQDEGWVKWNVSFAEAANYNVTVNIDNENGHNYTVALYRSESDESPITIGEGAQKSTIGTLELGALEVPAGNYIMKVTNATQYSDAKLISVNFSYAGGAAVDLSKDAPANLLANADAIISDDWSIEGGKIVHPESKALTGWAKWNVNSADYGNYNVTVNIASDNGHLVRVEIFEDEAAAPIYTLDETSATQYHTGDQAIDLGNIVLDAREYVVKVSNTGEYSHVQIASIVISYQNGARATLPASCAFADLMLSEKAHVTDGNLWFNTIGDSNPVGQWAKWNVRVAEAGTFLFDMNVSSTNGQSFKISILDMNENELDAFESGSVGSGDKEIKHYFNLAAGNYIVKLENTYSWSQGHVVSLAVTQPELIVLDEMAATNAVIHDNYRNGEHDIQIIRSIVPGMYNTICLPFDVSSSKLQAIFGSDVELLQMASATLDGGVLSLNFDNATSIYRGTPYLIKTSSEVVNPVFTAVEIKAEEGDATGGEGFDADFIGNFIKGEVPAGDQNLFLGQNNMLYFSQDATPIKGMRAYFHVKIPGAAQMIQHARIVTKDHATTAIDELGQESKSQKLIINGQLIIIRDGQKYNVMGAKIQ